MTDTLRKLVNTFRKPVYGIPLLFALMAMLVSGYFGYIAWAFPEVRCEAAVRHLDAPERMGDCYGCHVVVTPRKAMEWNESKHGVNLVRCQVCHGQPDGQGAIAFTRAPGISACVACHSVPIDRMVERFGRRDDCSSCHPNHASPIHGEAYVYRQDAYKPIGN